MRSLSLFLVPFSLAGCVAAWGGAYHIESEDSSGGAIRFDHVVISERAILIHANEICSKYQKTTGVENRKFGVVLPGGSIDEISFSCRTSNAGADGPSFQGAATQRELKPKRPAEDQAGLRREEEAATIAWHDCLAANVTGLAVVSNESAEIIVRAAYAACSRQREVAREVFSKELSDQEAGERIVRKIEAVNMDQFMLTVIRARAAKRALPPARTPSIPPARPAPEERAI